MNNNVEKRRQALMNSLNYIVSHYQTTTNIEELNGALNSLEKTDLSEEQVPELRTIKDVIIKRMNELKSLEISKPMVDEAKIDIKPADSNFGESNEIIKEDNPKVLRLENKDRTKTGFVNIFFMILSILIVIAVAAYFVLVKNNV